mmetsp:Transcript_10989/g.29047  ORF Transcript_10989/g.29047 Transcript_10989/m.29047 type:complete len:99 (-) Transcript_10989:429-725(-)
MDSSLVSDVIKPVSANVSCPIRIRIKGCFIGLFEELLASSRSQFNTISESKGFLECDTIGYEPFMKGLRRFSFAFTQCFPQRRVSDVAQHFVHFLCPN